VTVLNTWQRPGEDGTVVTFAMVQCDGCFPPDLIDGTAAGLRAAGWRFDEFERGPHRCPLCPSSGARKPRAALFSGAPAPPNLIVIGAAKSGTTSLHRYLSAHPEIQMPDVKELRFFQDPRCLERLDEYSRFFDARVPVRGEATPAYTAYPLVPGVPERIREAIPEAKLIYVVREPAERALAAYAEARVWEKEQRSADEALGDLQNPYNAYLAESRYATQVERYLAVFPREQLLVISQQDLLERRIETLRGVFRFLEVDEDFTSPRFEDLANTRAQKRRRNRVGRMLRNSPLLELVLRIPERPRAVLLRPLRPLMSRPLQVTVDPEVRARLEDALEGEIERLTAMVGPLTAGVS
jgi:Sulfotransferase domain